MTFAVEDDMEFESASDNPELVAAAEALASKTQAPALEDPLDGPVTLPAGFFRTTVDNRGQTSSEEVTKAWVRELNGADEERVARARLRDDTDQWVQAILECGVERLGDKKPTKDDFESLVLGDRDYLLLEISRMTYGNDLDYEGFICPNCREEISFVVHKDEDIPLKRLEKVTDSQFEVELGRGRTAKCSLPTVDVAPKVAKAATPAEANTLLIAAAVEEINAPGKETQYISGDEEAARNLSVRDRQKLVQEMSDRMPGPRYNEVTFEHSGDRGCGKEIRLTVSLADLFLGL